MRSIISVDRTLVWGKARASIWRWRRGLAAIALSALVTSGALLFAGLVLADDERLGTVRFPISCSWLDQGDFTTATALLHLFQFADAEDVFTVIARRSPDCAIAYWGIAMSRFRNPLYELPSPDDVAVAQDALRAGALARLSSPRERAYLSAVGSLFNPAFGTDWRARLAAYVTAMADVAAQFPDDLEATIFYALALNVSSPNDKGRSQTKAAELLLQVFGEEPNHPGIGHYLAFCLGHAAYQPKPFERAQKMRPTQRVLLGAMALLALGGLGAFMTLTSDVRPGGSGSSFIGGPFVLTASDGRTVTDMTFRGRWMLIYFGYTHCPDVCPTTLLSIANVLEKLGPLAANVQPVFVTIDPERDSPETVGEFTNAFDARIIGLTGSIAEIAAVAKQYRVFFKKQMIENGEDYLMEHSSYIYLMNPDGRYVTLFTHEQTDRPDEIAARMSELLTAPGRLSAQQ